MLDAAEQLGCERLVHVSSVATWGYEHRVELDEDSPPRPCGIPYIDTKGASDALALDRARRGEPVAVVRPGDVYGPGSTPWAVRPLEAMRANRFMLIGRGQGVMTPVYIDDLVQSILLALTVPGVTGRGYTVVGRRPGFGGGVLQPLRADARAATGSRGSPVSWRDRRRRPGGGRPGHRKAAALHAQRDLVRVSPRAVFEPARPRAARLGAAAWASRRECAAPKCGFARRDCSRTNHQTPRHHRQRCRTSIKNLLINPKALVCAICCRCFTAIPGSHGWNRAGTVGSPDPHWRRRL